MPTGTMTFGIALMVAVAACRNPPDSTAVRDTTGARSTSRVDKQAEERKIRGLEQRWREALAAKDTAAVGRFYTDGAFYLPAGSDGYEGPDRIRSRWAGEFSGRRFDLKREPRKVEVADAGDLAYEVGTYNVSWDKPQKGQATGNYVTVWKKENGEWKTAAYIWNRGEERP